MSQELVWINGTVSPLESARVDVEDRGNQFGDGVYEVIRIYNGVPFTLAEHLARLQKSAAGIRLQIQYDSAELAAEILTFVDRAALDDAMIYLQVSRGVQPRNHLYDADLEPTVLFYVRALPPIAAPGVAQGLKLITVPDLRWKMCHIKAIALLANVLAKNQAADQGADEAAFADEAGNVCECSTANLFLVRAGGIFTHPQGNQILPGITRDLVLRIARDANISVHEIDITPEMVRSADEIFITSTTREIAWVREWDGRTITSRVGRVTLQLHHAYASEVKAVTARTRVGVGPLAR